MGTLIFLLIVGGLGYAGYRTYHKQKAEYEEQNRPSGQTTAVVTATQTQPTRRLFQSPAEQAGQTQTKKGKLKSERIIDEWIALAGGAQGKADQFSKLVIRELQTIAVPNLKVEYRDVTGGTIGALFKPTRRYLIVDNKYFKGYRVFIGAKDYGKQLSISFYLTVEQSILGKMMVAASKSLIAAFWFFPVIFIAKLFQLGRGYSIPEMMDLFDREELSDYVSTINGAVKNAVKEVMKEMNLDFTKVDIKSRGFHNLTSFR